MLKLSSIRVEDSRDAYVTTRSNAFRYQVRLLTGEWLCRVTIRVGPQLQTAPGVVLKTFALRFQSPTGLRKLKVGAEIPGHEVRFYIIWPSVTCNATGQTMQQ